MSLFAPADNVFDSLHDMCAFSSKDWGEEKEGAWLYGIVCGWDDDDDPDCSAMSELQARFGWSDEAIARLRRLREQWLAAEKRSKAPLAEEGS